jgi:hypothetical protein
MTDKIYNTIINHLPENLANELLEEIHQAYDNFDKEMYKHAVNRINFYVKEEGLKSEGYPGIYIQKSKNKEK